MRLLLSSVLIILLASILYVQDTHGANVLVLFPTPSKSHTILGLALVKGLLKNGHNVTFVSPFPQEKSVKDYTDIGLSKVKEIFIKHIEKNGGIFKANTNNGGQLFQIFNVSSTLTDATLEDDAMQKILKSNEKFDAIIISSFMNEALSAIGHHLKAPVIGFSTSGPSFIVNDYVGNPSAYSYVPEAILPYSDRMTFYQRLVNSVLQFAGKVIKHVIHYPNQEAIIRKYFPDAPGIFDIMKNTALLLLNSHVSLSYPRPMVANMIEVGGLHVPKPNPLPKDLQDFMDSARDGVIYFSLGTNVPSKDMPAEIKNSLVTAFGKVKQRVLWKWDEPTIPGLSDNVRLSKWYPQSDILAHPNVKLFITHGGLLSTTETVIRGVPCLGIPIFADQFKNMEKAEKDGYASQIDHSKITVEYMTSAINEMLNNSTYTENVKNRSKLFNDQIVHPLDKAIYWIEYVIRHKGAPHLRSAGADIPLYQYLLLDVIGFVLLVLVSILIILYFVIKLSISYVRKRFCKTKSKKD